MRGRYAWSDVRAGWIDARRTDRPRLLRGFRLGGLDYGAGFAAGVVVIPAWNALVRRAWYAFGCPPSFPLRRIR